MQQLSALLALWAGNSPVTSDVEFWCFFICARINGWVKNDEAGEFRRHRAHYDVTVMWRRNISHELSQYRYCQCHISVWCQVISNNFIGNSWLFCAININSVSRKQLNRQTVNCHPSHIAWNWTCHLSDTIVTWQRFINRKAKHVISWPHIFVSCIVINTMEIVWILNGDI